MLDLGFMEAARVRLSDVEPATTNSLPARGVERLFGIPVANDVHGAPVAQGSQLGGPPVEARGESGVHHRPIPIQG